MVQLDLRASLVSLPRADRRGFQRLKRAKPPSWPRIRQPPQHPSAARSQNGSRAAGAHGQILDQKALATETAQALVSETEEAVAPATAQPVKMPDNAAHSAMDPYGDLGSTPHLAGYSSRSVSDVPTVNNTVDPQRSGPSTEAGAHCHLRQHQSIAICASVEAGETVQPDIVIILSNKRCAQARQAHKPSLSVCSLRVEQTSEWRSMCRRPIRAYRAVCSDLRVRRILAQRHC